MGIPSKEEIAEIRAKFEEIYQAVVQNHPEMIRLRDRVDQLLRNNTDLVLENRTLKGPINAICMDSGIRDIAGVCPEHGGDACLINPHISHAERGSGLEAMQVLFKALGWNSGGLASAAIEIVEQRDRAFEAIRKHRSQKADDRCIEDDDRLYEVLGDGIKCDRSVGDKEAMLKNCKRFIENRCTNGKWPTYAELEQKVAELQASLNHKDDFIRGSIRHIAPPTMADVKAKKRDVPLELADD